jgi:hypothetical protein
MRTCSPATFHSLKKASENRSAPFTRALSHLYTSATYIDELSVDPLESAGSAPATLMCLVEDTAKEKGGKVRIGMLAVVPSTGEVVYDGACGQSACIGQVADPHFFVPEFEDGHMRSG